MRRIMFASKGWKTLQEDYISEDSHGMHLEKLHLYLQRDISGYSYEEMTIHYGFLSHSALQTAVAAYMQTGTVEHAEHYFYLAARAKAAGDALWAANPHPQKRPQQGLEIPLDCVMAAVLSGCVPAALGMLEKIRLTFEMEPPGKHRGNSRQDETRKGRILLETNFYESLLNADDERAGRLLPDLEALSCDTLALQVMRAFLEQDQERFLDALIQHMKEFRKTPYPEELNYFVLIMEALYQRRSPLDPLDLADAPASLVKLPECDPALAEERLGVRFPSFDVEALLEKIDKKKIGPMFKKYGE